MINTTGAILYLFLLIAIWQNRDWCRYYYNSFDKPRRALILVVCIAFMGLAGYSIFRPLFSGC